MPALLSIVLTQPQLSSHSLHSYVQELLPLLPETGVYLKFYPEAKDQTGGTLQAGGRGGDMSTALWPAGALPITVAPIPFVSHSREKMRFPLRFYTSNHA